MFLGSFFGHSICSIYYLQRTSLPTNAPTISFYIWISPCPIHSENSKVFPYFITLSSFPKSPNTKNSQLLRRNLILGIHFACPFRHKWIVHGGRIGHASEENYKLRLRVFNGLSSVCHYFVWWMCSHTTFWVILFESFFDYMRF